MNENKVVLVTGASSGIGKAVVQGFLGQGMTVYAAARRVEKMEDLKAAGAKTVYMDLTQDESIQKALDSIKKESGDVGILVNNAGYGSYGAVEDVSLEEARRQFDVNLFGLARLTQLVLPGMRDMHSGRIINISSMGGKIYTPLGAWYHATKHALEGFSDCLRLEVKPFGIDVVVVEPGAIQSEWEGIAAESAQKTSGAGAYKDFTQKVVATMKDVYKNGQPSPPEVVANTVVKAALKKRPKTRYAVGKNAKLLLTLRSWLSDRGFDGLIRSSYKL
jgi:short-subunit dehydrogenase